MTSSVYSACSVVNNTEHAEYTEMTELIFEEESYRIRGAVFEVYREMGCGFLEPVYQECLEKELHHVKVPFVTQRELILHYKGERLNQVYKPDFICFDRILVKIKPSGNWLMSTAPKFITT